MASSLMLDDSIQERFWAKVDLLSSPTRCWLWTAATVRSDPDEAAEAARLKRIELFTHSDEATIFSKKFIG